MTPPARPPPPPDPDPSATWREVAVEVHALLPRLTDVWWAALPEPGQVGATARWPDILRRVPPAFRRPAWAGDLRRPPGLGAACPCGPGATVDLQPCDAAPPLTPPLAPSDRLQLSSWVGRALLPIPPPPPPPAGAAVAQPLPPRLMGWRWDLPLLPLLRCGDVHPHPGPLRVAQANLTSLRMHWHTVAEWLVDVVLLSETRLMAVAQRVMRAQAGASGWQAFLGAPRESLGGGGIWDATAGGRGSGCPRALPRDTSSPAKGRPGTR